LFGDRLALAERFADLLTGPAIERGLLGPNERERIWDRHLLNCAVISPLIHPGATVLDIGSGAGLPGIVLAITRPDLDVGLVEAMRRRSDFLSECVAQLDLPTVRVWPCRAEELVGQLATEVVVARAVAGLARLVQLSVRLVLPGGRLLFLKGRGVDRELAAAGPALRAAGCPEPRLIVCGEGVLAEPVRVVSIDKAGRAPREPRKATGGPTRRR
jgi:16S rRNA (guanine527-N7)-methyltransferase